MKTLSERLKLAMESNGKRITQAALARACNLSAPSVNDWLTGKTKTIEGVNLLNAAVFLKVSPVWLGSGKGKMREEGSNVSPSKPDTRRIPVINKIPAGGPRQIVDDYVTGSGMEDIATDLKLGDHAFALIIDGDSMLPDFKTGDKVIIDPCVRPRPGDFVAARCNGDEGTFKKYRNRGIDTDGREVFELVPLNEDYPTMRSDLMPCEIIGTMVEHRRLRRT